VLRTIQNNTIQHLQFEGPIVLLYEVEGGLQCLTIAVEDEEFGIKRSEESTASKCFLKGTGNGREEGVVNKAFAAGCLAVFFSARSQEP